MGQITEQEYQVVARRKRVPLQKISRPQPSSLKPALK